MGGVEPAESESMLAFILSGPFEPYNKTGARMNSWKSANLDRVEHAEDVEFAFLGKIGGIGEYCERDVHASQSSRQSMCAASFDG